MSSTDKKSELADKADTKSDTTTVLSNPNIAAASQESQQARLIAERYELIEQLGAGGMSTVSKVRHIHLDKIFALKLLHKLNEDSIHRFQQEAKASSRLEHPNIVAVRDFGVTDGQPFMLMDYLQGTSLAQIIKTDGCLDPKRIVDLFGQISSALAHAHNQGIVHRDVKPSNIMIVNREDGTEQAILVDFGIAKIMPQLTSKEAQQLTHTGDIFGTPFYMSPEQCLGQKLDARTDIYSLGCVMYECLTGNPPFLGDNVYETVHKQIYEAPQRFPDKLRKTALGRRLEALVLKAMAKSVSNRHKFMLEFATELKECEGNSTGLLGEIKSSWGILAGRRRAAEGKRILLKTGLQSFSILAVIIALLMLGLPKPMAIASRNEQRNSEIISLVNHICESRFDLKAIIKMEDTPGVFKNLKMLARLCSVDKEQSEKYKEFRQIVNKATNVAPKIAKKFRDTVTNEGMNMAGIQEFMSLFTSASSVWADATKVGAELVSMSQERHLKTLQSLQIMQVMLAFAAIMAPIVELSLLILLLKAWASLRDDKSNLDSAKNTSLP